MGIIAERITKARKELGLNQKELAKKYIDFIKLQIYD